MMNYKLAVVPGDGIGPEVVGQAIRSAGQGRKRNSDTRSNTQKYWQAAAPSMQKGECLPQETIDIMQSQRRSASRRRRRLEVGHSPRRSSVRKELCSG